MPADATRRPPRRLRRLVRAENNDRHVLYRAMTAAGGYSMVQGTGMLDYTGGYLCPAVGDPGANGLVDSGSSWQLVPEIAAATAAIPDKIARNCSKFRFASRNDGCSDGRIVPF